MGALHFLDKLVVPDAYDKSTSHELELFESGGRLFFRIWAGGIGANKPVVCELTPDQARQLSAGADSLAVRISED